MALDINRRTLFAAAALGLGLLVIGVLVGLPAWNGGSGTDEAQQEPAASEGQSPPASKPQTPVPAVEGTSPAAADLAGLSLPEAPAMQEGELVLSAAGFAAGETVTIAMSEGEDGATREVSQLSTDSQGRLDNIAITLPEWALSGAHVIQVTGQQSGQTYQDTVYVRAKEGFIELQDYAIRQSGTLGFVAGGFAAGEEVGVYFVPGQDTPTELSTEPVASITADRAGNTDWNEVQTPLLDAGRYTLVLRGSESEVEVTRVIEVQPLIPLLELNPWSGPPGTEVAINGKGYKPGEEVRVVFGGSNEPITTLTADEYGNVNTISPIEVPQNAGAGDVSVTLEGVESGASTTERFSVIGGSNGSAWGEMSSYAGPTGSVIYFGGGGFANGEEITVRHGDRSGPVVATGRAGIDGQLSRVGPATVPSDGEEEEITFTIVGESSGAVTSVKYRVLRPVLPPTPELQPLD